MNNLRKQAVLEKLAFTKESKLQSFIKARLSGAGLLKSVNRGSVPSIKELKAAGLSNDQALRVAQHAHGREAAAVHGIAKKAPETLSRGTVVSASHSPSSTRGLGISWTRHNRNALRREGYNKAPRGSAERKLWDKNEMSRRRQLIKLKKKQPGTRSKPSKHRSWTRG